jgi:hypothetical protein
MAGLVICDIRRKGNTLMSNTNTIALVAGVAMLGHLSPLVLEHFNTHPSYNIHKES